MFLYCIFFPDNFSFFLFKFALNLITTDIKLFGLTRSSCVCGIFEKQGGRKRLPKFKFSAYFSIGLHVILQIQIKKFENDCYIM